MTQKIHGYCALCISRCGCISTIEEGRLVKVEPDPSHPTGQSLCIKGRAAPELVYSDKRISKPLIRVNPKTEAEPQWQAISWDSALKTIAGKLLAIKQVHGSEAVCFSVTTPSATAICDSFGWVHRLAYSFGSPNILFATENCNWHKDFTSRITFGDNIGMPDYANTNCIILWGFNPAVTWLSQAHEIRQALSRGAKLIVVDPRKTGFAKKADEFLQLQPATDIVLALGIAQVLLKENWYDHGFIRRWTNAPLLVRVDTGELLCSEASENAEIIHYAWNEANAEIVTYAPATRQYSGARQPVDELTLALQGRYSVQLEGEAIECEPAFAGYQRACSALSLNEIASITGVTETQIRACASRIAHSGPVSFFTWTGTAQQQNATQTARAIHLLYALTGSVQAKGGNVHFDKPPVANMLGKALLSKAQATKNLGVVSGNLGPGRAMGWINSNDLNRSVLEGKPYKTRALVSFGGNPQLTKPDADYTQRVLASLEIYVHVDLFLNESAANADIVLPAASPWERSGLQDGFQVSQNASSHLQLRPPVVAPQGESQGDTAIVFQLAEYLGLSEDFFEGDVEAALNAVLQPSGVTTAELKATPEGINLHLPIHYQRYRKQGFATPSGKLEIFSSELQQLGFDPIPQARSASSVNADFPYRLISVKVAPYCHSQYRQLASLRKKAPFPRAYLHPNTARQAGIADNEITKVETSSGEIFLQAKHDTGIAPGVICCEYGWGQTGSINTNVNSLIDLSHYDPISGSNVLRDTACRISVPASNHQDTAD